MTSLGPSCRQAASLRSWLADQHPTRVEGLLARLRGRRQSHAAAFLGGIGSLIEMLPPEGNLSSESATVIVGRCLADDFADDCRRVALDFSAVLVDLPPQKAVPGV